MTPILLALTTLLACSSGTLDNDCPEGQVDDGSGNCVDDSSGDGGSIDDGGSEGDGGTEGDGGSSTDGGSEGDGGSSTDGGSEDCTASVISTDPDDGATDVALGSRITFVLSGADATGVVTVETSDGTTVSGSSWTANDDTNVVFEADGPLAGATEHIATLDYCGGSEVLTFTTEDPGDPVSDLIGRSYAVDLASATWVEPEGVGDLISGSLTGDLLLGVSDADDSTISMFGTLGTDTGEQDTCEPYIDFPTAEFTENPFFQLGPSDVAFEAGGYTVPLSSLKLAGSFNDDASAIVDATMSAELDVRDLGELISATLGTSDPDDICGLLVLFGVSCETCSGDGADYCLGVLVEDVDANERSGSLDEIDQADCHPTCDASYSNPDCDTSGF